MAEGVCDSPSGGNPSPRGYSSVVVCKYVLKVRFAVAKTLRNRVRMYYGCPNYKRDDACDFFRWIHVDEELYVETSATTNSLEAEDLSRKVKVLKQSLEDARSEVDSLTDENELLRKMTVVQGLKDHGYVVEGELIFRRTDAVLEELQKVRRILFKFQYCSVALVGGICVYLSCCANLW